jgi:hypothetical protein
LGEQGAVHARNGHVRDEAEDDQQADGVEQLPADIRLLEGIDDGL